MYSHPPANDTPNDTLVTLCNNFLRNAYFFMEQIFLNTSTSFQSIVNISKVLDMFPAYQILFKSGISSELAEN